MALNRTYGWYQKVVSGARSLTPDQFARLADLLGFSRHHRRVACLDAFQSEPMLPAEPSSPHWKRVLDGQREMACLLSPAGRLLGSNSAFAELFPKNRQPANLWHWALLDPEARTVLLRWDEQWAPAFMALLRLARFRYPENRTVRSLYMDVHQDRRLQQIQESDRGLGDDARPLRHPVRGVGTARFMIAETEGAQVLTVLFEASA
ncbi:sulfotransferase [Streptomyces olivaceoviridis]|uniref:MmyB family transcriptional regulator n=1 Tax=Streptomyces olivaceoviridis TaxID=1921 RepID=UPI00332789B3